MEMRVRLYHGEGASASREQGPHEVGMRPSRVARKRRKLGQLT